MPGDTPASPAADYEKVVLIDRLTDPMELAVAPDGRVFVAERMGAIKMWDPSTEDARLVGYVPVNMTIEDGLLGLTLDPDFDDNRWMYVYYAPIEGGPQRLSRLTFEGDWIDMGTERILLEVEIQREYCCHSAGSLAFDAQGNLYLSTGDNTLPSGRAGSPMDERPGRAYNDARRTSGNTNDLRGKILRIHPEPDGSYTIPEGNLFPPGTPLTRPEIYTMGHRNPFRISIDARTGDLFWGDVGNGDPPNELGPWGWDEWNRARGPGNFGWPFFAGRNEPYREYDYATRTAGDYFDPAAPVNNSPNNTGARILPPAQPALIWYTYGASEDFPQLGNGGINPMAGPLYRYDAGSASPQALPASYDGRLILYEWMRNWVKVVTFDDAGEIQSIDPFLPGIEFVRPTDMEVGVDGRFYVAEWGDAFWGSNPNARLVRIDYYGAAERPPATAKPRPADPPLTIAWPVDGGFFDFDVPMAFKIEKAGAGSLAPEQVVVQPYTGFDTHMLPLSAQTGVEGTFRVTRDFTHRPDLHFVDRFAVLEARYTGGAADATPARVQLQPKQKEAEHVAAVLGARRHTYGVHPAAKEYGATALTVMQVKAGDYVSYAPVNLAGINALTFRLKTRAPGTIEVRLDAPDGALLAEATVDEASMSPVEAVQARAVAQVLAEEAEVEGLDPAAYQDWAEMTVPVNDPGGTHELFLVFRSEASRRFLELDWIHFDGQGMTYEAARE